MIRPLEALAKELQSAMRHSHGFLVIVLMVTAAMAAPSCGETEYNIAAKDSVPGRGGNSGFAGSANSDKAGSAGHFQHTAGGQHPAGAAGASAGMAGTSTAAGAGAAGGSTSLGGRSGGIGGGTTVGGINSSGGLTSTSNPAGGSTSAGAQGGSPTNGGANPGVGGDTNLAGTGPCGIAPNSAFDRAQRKMLLRDEGAAKLAFIDVGNPAKSWIVPLVRETASGIQGRDLQLVGNCRVLTGTDVGYEEYDIRDGARLSEVTGFPNTVAAHRLRNGNTMLVGVGTSAEPYQSSLGIVLIEIDAASTVINRIVYPGTYARLVRPTATGTFLVTNNTRVFEGDATGAIVTPFPSVELATLANPQVWKALSIATGTPGVSEVVLATGYRANLTIFRTDGTVRRTITGGTASITGGASAVNPYFFAEVQVLGNGNFVVANWAGHGPGLYARGIPILEYTPAGALAWYWGDPSFADRLSSIQGVIVLDGLDPTRLHVEDTNGQQVPVN